jgi:hypothetical protein
MLGFIWHHFGLDAAHTPTLLQTWIVDVFAQCLDERQLQSRSCVALLFTHQESKWRKVVEILPSKKPQILLHNMQYYVDSSLEVWDAEKDALL